MLLVLSSDSDRSTEERHELAYLHLCQQSNWHVTVVVTKAFKRNAEW